MHIYMLEKYSHFSDLQANDKYKTNSTIECMLSLKGMHPPPTLCGCLQIGGGEVKSFRKVFAGGKRGSEIFIWVRGVYCLRRE